MKFSNLQEKMGKSFFNSNESTPVKQPGYCGCTDYSKVHYTPWILALIRQKY